MAEFFEQLPVTLKEHIAGITKSAGLGSDEESLDIMAEAWLGKKEAFEREIEARNMEEVSELDKEDTRGALVMTYSGSLINIGPKVDESRSVSYSSIGIRSDVPDSAENDASDLAQNVEVDMEVAFRTGPVSVSSPAYKIAVVKEDLSAEDEEEMLANTTVVLSKEFANINKTLIIDQ